MTPEGIAYGLGYLLGLSMVAGPAIFALLVIGMGTMRRRK